MWEAHWCGSHIHGGLASQATSLLCTHRPYAAGREKADEDKRAKADGSTWDTWTTTIRPGGQLGVERHRVRRGRGSRGRPGLQRATRTQDHGVESWLAGE